MIAAIAVTRPDCLFRFLLAMPFSRATHIIALFDTAFAVAANVQRRLWFIVVRFRWISLLPLYLCIVPARPLRMSSARSRTGH
jgi:hypothetical protein